MRVFVCILDVKVAVLEETNNKESLRNVCFDEFHCLKFGGALLLHNQCLYIAIVTNLAKSPDCHIAAGLSH
jgi:hypothetical protein